MAGFRTLCLPHTRGKTVELIVSSGNIAEGFLLSFAEDVIDGYDEQLRKNQQQQWTASEARLVFSEPQPGTRLESKDNLIH